MLRKGQRFTLNGRTYRVVYVTDLRAHCVACSKRHVTVTDKHGRTRSFDATEDGTLNISPDSCLDLCSTSNQKGHPR